MRNMQNNYMVRDVPNAIVLDDKIPNKKNNGYDYLNNCVLEVARIEPTKNQLGVLLASMNSDYPIVFVGAINQKYIYYYKELTRLAKKRGNVYFLGEKTQDELLSIYKRAKVHVLPSFRESPGLVSLEALLNDCNIVVANGQYCPIKYYKFDNYGYVCDPYNIQSINSAIEKAMIEPLKIQDKSYFLEYSYERVAECTYEAYAFLLGNRKK